MTFGVPRPLPVGVAYDSPLHFVLNRLIKGPNAPLSDACGNSQQPSVCNPSCLGIMLTFFPATDYSAQAAINQWTKAGFPASKLLLGLPLYGYVSNSTATSLRGIAMPPPNFPISVNQERVGITPAVEENLGDGKPVPGNHARDKSKRLHTEAAGDLSGYFGQQIAFSTLVSAGALQKNSDGTYTANGANGYTQGMSHMSTAMWPSNLPYLKSLGRLFGQ